MVSLVVGQAMFSTNVGQHSGGSAADFVVFFLQEFFQGWFNAGIPNVFQDFGGRLAQLLLLVAQKFN
jgi:hypothetical protein